MERPELWMPTAIVVCAIAWFVWAMVGEPPGDADQFLALTWLGIGLWFANSEAAKDRRRKAEEYDRDVVRGALEANWPDAPKPIVQWLTVISTDRRRAVWWWANTAMGLLNEQTASPWDTAFFLRPDPYMNDDVLDCLRRLKTRELKALQIVLVRFQHQLT